MKKMTTVFAMIALACTLSTLAFGQHGKRNQRGMQGGITGGRQATGSGHNAQNIIVAGVPGLIRGNKATRNGNNAQDLITSGLLRQRNDAHQRYGAGRSVGARTETVDKDETITIHGARRNQLSGEDPRVNKPRRLMEEEGIFQRSHAKKD